MDPESGYSEALPVLRGSCVALIDKYGDIRYVMEELIKGDATVLQDMPKKKNQ